MQTYNAIIIETLTGQNKKSTLSQVYMIKSSS